MTSFGVKPMNQASFESFVVPVLPAAGSLKPSRLTLAAVPALTTSAIMFDIRNAVVSLVARDDKGSDRYNRLPSRSSTRRIRTGVGTLP